MTYDDIIDNKVRLLQQSLSTSADGAWGAGSQKALIAAGKKISFDWSVLRDNLGSFTQEQVDGFNVLIDAINTRGGDALNPLYAAYVFATTWHETDKRMASIEEYGKGSTRNYGKWFKNSKGIEYGHANYKGAAYLKSEYPHLYYGRGLPQLTWLDNYKKMGLILNLGLVDDPSLALVPENSARIMIEGMLLGSFTGLSLSRCIRYGSYAEFVYCRRIINGTDRDSMIAKYAIYFLSAINYKD